ncbi:hypothetical protein [Halobellus ordinarius]|uniref:hypothetical protein n=1 Tax=Halobellus ordinarius TaxID=3075120 RepID=UPI0028807F7C|nr:hypothetical protein [Halobellus sp. ZY16]
MVDLLFQDVILDSRETRTTENGVLVDKGWRAMCKTCSTVHTVELAEFDVPVTTFSNGEKHIPVDDAVFRFVAEMRAWNCCHEGEEPYDGFPETPDCPYGIELG